MLIVLTFGLVLNVSMDKGSEAGNELQMDNPTPHPKIRSYQTPCADDKARAVRSNVHTHAQCLRVNPNNTRLKQPVGQNNSNGSLKTDIMISQTLQCLSLYLHSVDSLLAIELIIDHIQHF